MWFNKEYQYHNTWHGIEGVGLLPTIGTIQ